MRSAASSTRRPSVSSSAATVTSTASSPTLRATAPMPASRSSVVYEPSGRSAARCGDRAPERGREARGRAGVARRAGGSRADEQRVAVAVVADLLDRQRVPGGRALAPKPLRGSGSRTRPRRSRASAARPPRSSSRASARGSSAASWTIAAFKFIGPALRARALPRAASRAAAGSRAGSRRAAQPARRSSASATCARVPRAARGDHRQPRPRPRPPAVSPRS